MDQAVRLIRVLHLPVRAVPKVRWRMSNYTAADCATAGGTYIGNGTAVHQIRVLPSRSLLRSGIPCLITTAAVCSHTAVPTWATEQLVPTRVLHLKVPVVPWWLCNDDSRAVCTAQRVYKGDYVPCSQTMRSTGEGACCLPTGLCV